jgi:hypothetical protein
MATEPTLIRRYTPPTCSLEIMAQPSALSRWMGKTALKDVKFKLSFDDPRVSDEEWVAVRGDRQQLEELTQVVGDYVQSLLVQAPIGGGTIEHNIAAQTAIAPTTAGIALQPIGLLSHELRLGSLATAGKPETLRLSSTQLADLSTALDEYEAEATALPELDRSRKVAWLPSPAQWGAQNWAGLAAGMLVVVGLGASLLNSLSNRNVAPTTVSQASSSDQRLSVPPPNASPAPSPLVTIPPLAKLPTTALPTPGANSGTAPQIATANSGETAGNSTSGAKTIQNTPGSNSPIVITPPPKPGAAVSDNEAAKSSSSGSATGNQVAIASADDLGGNVEFKAAAEPVAEGAERAKALGSTPMPPAPVPQPAAIARTAAPAGNSQAGEVQAFFSDRWKPGANQKALQYTIELNADGSFKSGAPIGSPAEAAGTAILPEPGAKIAPPSANGQSTSFTLLLEAGGGVQAISQ